MDAYSSVNLAYIQQHTQTSPGVDSNLSNIFKLNTSSVPFGCTAIESSEFVPWNNPHNIVSFEVAEVVRKLKALFFLPLLFLIGFPANVINMAVFYKQGMKERVNVCLFFLSLADALHLLQNMLLYGEQIHLQLTTKETFGPVMLFMSSSNMFGFYGFIWVSQVISAIIASDRCFCVLRPFRSQNLMSGSTMAAIIGVLYVVIVGLFFVVATRYRIKCSYDPASDTAMLVIVPSPFYYRHQELINCLDMVVFGTVLPILVIVVVTVTTIITTVKLRQAAHWRAETSSRRGLSQQEIALTKMLASNSALFIVCVIPLGVFRLVPIIMPEMNPNRRNHNFHMTFKWIVVAISYINSTFNIVIYYTMGSRYRHTFWQLFSKKVTPASSTVCSSSLP